jgi:hypothetical protein
MLLAITAATRPSLLNAQSVLNVSLVDKDVLLTDAIMTACDQAGRVHVACSADNLDDGLMMLRRFRPRLALVSGEIFSDGFRELTEELTVRLGETRIAVFADGLTDSQLEHVLATPRVSEPDRRGRVLCRSPVATAAELEGGLRLAPRCIARASFPPYRSAARSPRAPGGRRLCSGYRRETSTLGKSRREPQVPDHGATRNRQPRAALPLGNSRGNRQRLSCPLARESSPAGPISHQAYNEIAAELLRDASFATTSRAAGRRRYCAKDRAPFGDPVIGTPIGSGRAATSNPLSCAASCSARCSSKLSG